MWQAKENLIQLVHVTAFNGSACLFLLINVHECNCNGYLSINKFMEPHM